MHTHTQTHTHAARQYLRPDTQGSYRILLYSSISDATRLAQSAPFSVLAPPDACGVCGGNGSSCAGCDGVPNSGKKLDKCGICDGKNACVGCDGVPNSGVRADACGVCRGDNTTCMGCDGMPRASGSAVYDSCGVCGGKDDSCAKPPAVFLLPSVLGYACAGKSMRIMWKAPTNRSASDHLVVCRYVLCVYMNA
jgi:hypothetical protein